MQNDDLIDNSNLLDNTPDITLSSGASFSANLRVAASAFLAIGVGALISGGPGFILGPILLTGGLFFLTSKHGSQICYETQYIKEYSEVFFIKSGKWKTTYAMPDICILKIGKTTTLSDITGGVKTKLDNSKIEIYIMSSTHRKRYLLKICKTQKEAVELADYIASNLNKKVVKFNPKISDQTKARLRARR